MSASATNMQTKNHVFRPTVILHKVSAFQLGWKVTDIADGGRGAWGKQMPPKIRENIFGLVS